MDAQKQDQHDIWVVDQESGVATTPTDLWNRIEELATRLSILEATYETPSQRFEEWLRTTIAETYYMQDDEIDQILANTALTREFQALHIWWGAAYSPRQSGPRARAEWHDGFTRVLQRTKDWVSRKRSYGQT